MKLSETILNDYWMKYYISEPGTEGRCTLCGNSGILDTRGVKDVCGNDVGCLNYCICPNGQELREIANETALSFASNPGRMFGYAEQDMQWSIVGELSRQSSELKRLNDTLHNTVENRDLTIGRHELEIKRLNKRYEDAYRQTQQYYQQFQQARATVRKWKHYYHELLTRVAALQSMLDRVEFVDPKRAERYDKLEQDAT